MEKNNSEFAKNYSEESFWEKIKKYALSAGRDITMLTLKLFYALKREETPLWAKTVIVSSLGYFISPIDAIPDLTPVIGYVDDLGVLTLALATVSIYIDEGVVKQAEQWVDNLFGSHKK